MIDNGSSAATGQTGPADLYVAADEKVLLARVKGISAFDQLAVLISLRSSATPKCCWEVPHHLLTSCIKASQKPRAALVWRER